MTAPGNLGCGRPETHARSGAIAHDAGGRAVDAVMAVTANPFGMRAPGRGIGGISGGEPA